MAKTTKKIAAVELGQKVEVLILSLAYGGDGVGRFQDFTLFVPFSVPGDKLEVEVSELHKTYARTKILRVLEKSSGRVEPSCPIALECGGCGWQQIDYHGQLLAKRRFILDALERIG